MVCLSDVASCVYTRAVFQELSLRSVSGVVWMDVFAIHSQAITARLTVRREKESGGPAERGRLHLHELQTCTHLSHCPHTPRDLRRDFGNTANIREDIFAVFSLVGHDILKSSHAVAFYIFPWSPLIMLVKVSCSKNSHNFGLKFCTTVFHPRSCPFN